MNTFGNGDVCVSAESIEIGLALAKELRRLADKTITRTLMEHVMHWHEFSQITLRCRWCGLPYKRYVANKPDDRQPCPNAKLVWRENAYNVVRDESFLKKETELSSQHSPEPWELKSKVTTPSEASAWVVAADGSLVLYEECNDHELPEITKNLSRIIACVNACAGIPTNELHMINAWRQTHQHYYREGGAPT